MQSRRPHYRVYGLLFALCLASSVSRAEPVVQDDRLWIQPSDVAPVTWLEVDAVCPAPDRICSGTLNSVDVSGFRWATSSEVVSLWSTYGPFPQGDGTDSETMDRFIAEFNPTDILDIPIVAAVAGWVNDPVVDGTQTLVPREGFIGYAQDVVSDAPALIPDCFCYGNLVKSDSSFEQHLIPPLEEYDVNIGAWLWKSTAENTQLQVVLEEPVNGDVHGGIGNLRGWAISSETIDRIEIYIDGVFAFDAPYGGSRPDVSELFPTVPGSEQSGFSLAYGYSNLEAGIHTITAKAITAEGSIAESTSTFTVVRFDEVFIGPEQTVDTSQAVITVAGDEILMNGILVGDKIYDLRLKWRTAEQGFEIIEIQ